MPHSNGSIVAAVKFDTAASRVVDVAAYIAARSGRQLHLMHCYSTEFPVYGTAFAELSAARGGLGTTTFVPEIGDHAPNQDDHSADWSSPLEVAKEHLARFLPEGIGRIGTHAPVTFLMTASS